MPEGPEVATIVRALGSQLRGRKIVGAENSAPWELLLEPDSHGRIAEVVGTQILEVKRVGKTIVLVLGNGLHFLVHLLMTGQLLYGDAVESPYLRWCLLLDNGERLCLADKRKWVRARILSADEFRADRRLYSLGVDVLSDEFTLAAFMEILRSTRRKAHVVLLDQKRISGLGNIYVNEALFCAATDPRTPANAIPAGKAHALYWAIYYIVREAYRRNGTTFSDYRTPDGKRGRYQECLRVFRRKGKPCVHCGAPITTLKIGGRGAYVCPHDQLGEPLLDAKRVAVHDTKGQWAPRLYVLPNGNEDAAHTIARNVPFVGFAETKSAVGEILARGDDAVLAANEKSIADLRTLYPLSVISVDGWEAAAEIIYRERCACPAS